MLGSPGVVTEAGGLSAGVSIVVPKPTLFSFCAALGRWDLSPQSHPGRAVLGWVNAGIKGGVLVVVIYLYDGEGWSDRNISIMHEVSSALVALGQPFVLMGDFNMSPSEFVQGCFLDSVKGVLLAPDEPTFQATNSNSVIDYFIISSSLACAVSQGPWVQYGGVGPHHSVHLVINGCGRDQVVNSLCRPARFAVEPPCGPCRPFFFSVG